MIYYLKLLFSYDYSGKAKGNFVLTTTTDERKIVINLDFTCLVDADLNALVVAVDPNALLPLAVTTVPTNHNFEYDLEKSVADTTELNTLFGLLNNLNVA